MITALVTYSAEWKAMIRERYSAEPVITYFDTPVVVDNATGEISSDG
jgi:predicted RNase H-like nuclease